MMTEAADKKLYLEAPGVMLGFDTGKGVFDLIDTTSGLALISQATAGFNGLTFRSASIEAEKIPRGFLFSALFDEGKIKMDLKLALHPEGRIFTLDSTVTNLSDQEICIQEISPLSLFRDEGGNLFLNRIAAYCFGYHSWDESRVIHFGREPVRAMKSHWMTVLEDTTQSLGLLLGFTDFSLGLPSIELYYDRGCSRLKALSSYDALPLAPGKSLKAERFVIAIMTSGMESLDLWTDLVRKGMKAGSFPHSPVGWCSWYQLYENIDEEYILKNLDAASAQGFFDYFMIDDGYQESEGSWLRPNERFPGGILPIVRKIHEKGLSAGLWVAPFMVSEDSEVYRKHPDWLIKTQEGNPAALRQWRRGPVYGLDISHPGAQKWLHHIFTVMSEEWGVDLFKLDFLYLGAATGERYRKNWTAAQCYRRGLEIIREVIGRKFILGCGAPLGHSIGLVDAMRISGDVAASWNGELSAMTSISNTLTRYFTHRKLWINDPDCVITRDAETSLSLQEVETLLTVVGLSGGIVATGDDLSRLAPERLAMLRRIVPPSEESATPVDLFAGSLPGILDRRLERPFAAWHIAALINFQDSERDLAFDLSTLDMRRKEYLVYELWQDRFLGIFDREVVLNNVPPHGTRLLCVRALHRFPQLIATDLHITMGGVEVKSCVWSTPSKSLSLRIHVRGATPGKLLFYVPEPYRVERIEPDAGSFEGSLRSDGLYEVRGSFGGDSDVKIFFRQE